MKKFIILSFTAALAVTFTACSGKDEPKPVTKAKIELSDNPVDFNVVTPELDFNSRSYTTDNLNRITVISAVGSQEYMNCHVSKTSDGVWQTNDGYTDGLRTYFWPWSGMDVYAFADNFEDGANNVLNNTNVTFGNVNGHYCPTSIEYQVNHGNGASPLSLGPKFDPLIACAPNQTMKTNNGSVHLNFKHLLSRVTFAVVNDNADDKVNIQIKQIAIDKLYSHGKYNLYPQYTGTPLNEGEVLPDYYGWWSDQDNINNHSTYEALNFSTTRHTESNGEGELAPQTVYKPKVNESGADEPYELLIVPQTTKEVNNTELCVDCRITSADGNKVFWPTDGSEFLWLKAPFPSEFTFKQNTQYVVLIHIGEYNMDIEIRAYPWNVLPFEDGGELKPPTF